MGKRVEVLTDDGPVNACKAGSVSKLALREELVNAGWLFGAFFK